MYCYDLAEMIFKICRKNRIIIAAELKHKIPIKIIVLKQIKHYPASCAIIPSLMWKIVIRIHSFIHNHSSLSKIAQRGFIKRRFIN